MSGEDLGFLFALLLNGASIGLMYSLIALGFVLVYKATDAINFAQGEFVMMSGLIAAAILAVEGVPLIVAIGATFAVMIAFGFGFERIVLRPLLGRPVVAVIMATIGLAAVLRGLTPVVFGGETRALPLPIGDEPIDIGPASLAPIQVLGIVVTLVFFVGFSWFFKKSRMGVAMRAVADNQQVAQAMGINVERYFALAWAMAGIVSAAGGGSTSTATASGSSTRGSRTSASCSTLRPTRALNRAGRPPPGLGSITAVTGF